MKVILILILILFSIACKKKEIISAKQDFNKDFSYFGITKGNFIEYLVVHIVHDDEVDIHDTLQYKFKTVVGDTFIDNQGRKANKFFRYTWNDTNDSWKIKDVWSTVIDKNYAIVTEENQSIIKIAFPIKLSTEWNPSIFSTKATENYRYSSIHTPLKLNLYSFDSTITISQNNYYTLVDYKRQTETYAKNIGMISKYYKNLRIKNFDTLQVKKGEEWFYTLVKFGNELSYP